MPWFRLCSVVLMDVVCDSGGCGGRGATSSSVGRLSTAADEASVWYALITDLVRESVASGSAILYVHKRDTAGALAARLAKDGFRAASYSAKLRPAERAAVLERWRGRQLDVVVATVAFGMGIDRAGRWLENKRN